jgi:prevent-host-death family protein
VKEVKVREREPITRTMKASEARQNFSQLLNQVFRGETRVVVEKSGIPVAAIISAQDLEEFRRFEAEREKDFAIIDEIRAAFKDVPDEELEREVTRAVAEARAKLREEARRGATAA